MSQPYPSCSFSNLPPIVLQVVVLLSSVLMNGNVAEVYASRMMLPLLLLAPVSAIALSRCSLLLTMRPTKNSVIDCWVR
jgi:multisubunit Na+/H+ antiporter MnhG subunit